MRIVLTFAIPALISSLLALLDFPDRLYTVNWDLGFCIQVLALRMFFLSYCLGQELKYPTQPQCHRLPCALSTNRSWLFPHSNAWYFFLLLSPENPFAVPQDGGGETQSTWCSLQEQLQPRHRGEPGQQGGNKRGSTTCAQNPLP